MKVEFAKEIEFSKKVVLFFYFNIIISKVDAAFINFFSQSQTSCFSFFNLVMNKILKRLKVIVYIVGLLNIAQSCFMYKR